MDQPTKKLIADGPMIASMGLFGDSSNPLEWGDEFIAFLKAKRALLDNPPYLGHPLFGLISEQPDSKESIVIDSDKDFQTYTASMLNAAYEKVVAHFDEDDVRMYGEFIVACLVAVAESAGGGLLGTSEEVDDGEVAYIEQVKAMFGLI